MMYNFSFVNPKMMELTRKVSQRDNLAAGITTSGLGMRALDNALILPGVGIIHEGRHVMESFVHNRETVRYSFNEDEIITVDDEVVYLGLWQSVWGHCITDNMKHLWMIESEHVPASIRNMQMVYCMFLDKPLPENMFKLLKAAGLDLNMLHKVSAPTRYRRVWLPDQCFSLDLGKGFRTYTEEYVNMIDRICSNILKDFPQMTLPEKIYFTRTGMNDRRDIGEDMIEECFASMGYSIYRPENLTLEEQISLLRNCTHFAATEGSISHNAIFMRSGMSIEVIRKADFINGYQAAIHHARNLNVTYIDANCSNLMVHRSAKWLGPFFLYINRHMADFAGVEPHFPIWRYCIYIFRFLKWKIFRRI